MDKIDSRTLPVDALNERRRRSVKMRLEGTSLKETAAQCEMSRTTVIAAVEAFEVGGWKAVDVDRGGRPMGSGRTLTAEQEREVQRLIRDCTPDQLKMVYAHSRRAKERWSGARRTPVRRDRTRATGAVQAEPMQTGSGWLGGSSGSAVWRLEAHALSHRAPMLPTCPRTSPPGPSRAPAGTASTSSGWRPAAARSAACQVGRDDVRNPSAGAAPGRASLGRMTSRGRLSPQHLQQVRRLLRHRGICTRGQAAADERWIAAQHLSLERCSIRGQRGQDSAQCCRQCFELGVSRSHGATLRCRPPRLNHCQPQLARLRLYR